eukprot:3882027-Rhodomonas_salina.3
MAGWRAALSCDMTLLRRSEPAHVRRGRLVPDISGWNRLEPDRIVRLRCSCGSSWVNIGTQPKKNSLRCGIHCLSSVCPRSFLVCVDLISEHLMPSSDRMSKRPRAIGPLREFLAQQFAGDLGACLCVKARQCLCEPEAVAKELSPSPARAMPSTRCRLTLSPIPSANTRVACSEAGPSAPDSEAGPWREAEAEADAQCLRTRSKTALSLETWPSVSTNTARSLPASCPGVASVSV